MEGANRAMIKRLYVHNYRCFENFELVLDKRPSTLLVGRNGSGKSTVGSVLEIFQSIARGKSIVVQLVSRLDFTQGRTETPMKFEIEVELLGQIYSYSLELDLPEGFTELSVADESLEVDGKTIFSRKGDLVFMGAKSKELPSIPFLPLTVALPYLQKLSETDPAHILTTWLARMVIISPIPALIKGESSVESLSPKKSLSNLGEWFSGLVTTWPAAYSTIAKYIRSVMPDFKSIQNPSTGLDSRRLFVQFAEGNALLDVPFGSLSDGEKCFFICAMVMAANESYGPIFCFWDEPDNYLSISEVGHFVMALRRAFKNSGQLFMISHNGEAINKFSSENTLFIDRKSHLFPPNARLVEDMNLEGDFVTSLILNDVEL